MPAFDPALFAAAWFDPTVAGNRPRPWFDDDTVAAGGGSGSYTLDFSLYPSTSFDAIPALTLRIGATGKMSVRSDGKPKNLGSGGSPPDDYVLYTLPVGVETIHSVTFLSLTFFGQGGMVLRADWSTGRLKGYKCAPSGSSTGWRVTKMVDGVQNGFDSNTDYHDFTFANDTDPVTFTAQTVGATVEIKAYQNGVQVGATMTDDSVSRITAAGAYGIFCDSNGYDPSMPLTYVTTGYATGAGDTYNEDFSLAGHVFVADAAALTGAPSLSLNAVGGLSDSSALSGVGSLSLNAVQGLTPASILTTAGAFALDTVQGSSFAAVLTAIGALSLNALVEVTDSAVLTGVGSFVLDAIEGLTVSSTWSGAGSLTLALHSFVSAEGLAEFAGAISLAAGAALAADGLLTIDAALSLATAAGYSDVGPITADALAEFMVGLSLAAGGEIEGTPNQTFDESLSLGILALATMAAQNTTTGALAFNAIAGQLIAGLANMDASASLGAGLAIAAQGALTIAQALQLDAHAAVAADGQRVITGAISLPAHLATDIQAATVLASGLSFEAVFDQDASASLDADAAIALALRTAVRFGIITGNHVAGISELSAGLVRTIDLAGSRISGATLGGSDPDPIVLSGSSIKRTGLAGAFTITIRLNGRLN